MVPTAVELTNFNSYYGTHFFDLHNKGLIGIMGYNADELCMDSNGSGKSTIIDALDWGCYGKVSRDNSAKSVFNDEALLERGSKCEVRCWWLTDEGHPLTITRGMTKSGSYVELEVNGQKFEALDISETQAEIEKYLGADREVFHASILFGQNDLVHYADSSDAVRMRILTKILRLEDIDSMLDQAKAREKELVGEIASSNQKIAVTEGKISGLESQDFSVMISQWDADRQKQLIERQSFVAECTRGLESATQKSAGLPEKIAYLNQLKQRLSSLLGSVDRSGLAAMDKQLVDAKIGHADIIKDVSDRGARLNKFQSMGAGICGECEQSVRPEHVQGMIAVLMEEFSSLQIKQAQKKEYVEQCEQARTAVEAEINNKEMELQQARQLLNNEISSVSLQIFELEKEQAAIAEYTAKISQCQRDIQELTGKTNPYEIQLREQNDKVYQLRSGLIVLRQELASLENQLRHVSFWVKGFNFQGLKSYILDSRLQELTDSVNKWLRLITGGIFWVRFESQKKQASGKLSNAPDLRVFKWCKNGKIKETRYKKMSGGEKQRVSFGVDFGLASLLANRAGKKYDLLVLDEVFKHLDGTGKEFIMQVLPVLALEKSSLFVIEHDPEIQASLDTILYVIKENDRSRLGTHEEIYELIRLKKLEEIYGAEKAETEKAQSNIVQTGTNRKRTPRRVPIRSPVTPG